MKRSAIGKLPLLAVAVALSLGTSGCLFFGHKAPTPLAGMKAAPDKVLFERATDDIQHGRYTVARLTLQTLINTYPDSEYLAKAKLAIADSFYKEGGTDDLTQAVAQYKDFITFFPFLDQAAYAQYQVAMSHYRMMEKPDRDRTQALLAESEFQTMILKYPHSKWTAEADQRLREVQEVLAEGEFRVAQYYELRGCPVCPYAAAARLLELTERYPLYSKADQANFMLAHIYEKTEHNNYAARFYSNIVREYPLSPLVDPAKKRLVALGYPVPQPDPNAVARMKDERKYAHERPGILRDALGILKTGPDVSHAAHYGQPNLTAETDVIPAQETLQPSVVAAAAKASSGLSVASVTGPGDQPISSAAPGVTVSSGGTSPSSSQLSNEAKSMSDPLKGPKSGQKVAIPAAGPSEKTSPEAQPSANRNASKPAAKQDQKKKGVKKGKKQTKKKKKGIKKLIPW